MTQIVPIAKKAEMMRAFFDARKGEIGRALARVGVTPDRILRAVFTSAQKNPELYNCTPESTYKAVLLAAQAGLMPDGVTQQAHLIPRWNRKRKDANGDKLPEAQECNLQIGYRGYLTLCRRSGDVNVIDALLVRAGDEFYVEDGVPHHKPMCRDGFPTMNDAEGKERPILGVWAKAQFKSGGTSYDWMSRDEIEALRRRSSAGGLGWDTDYGEMAKKTVLRRICKRLPQSEDAARLLELDAQAEAGVPQEIDIPVPPEDVDAMPRADAVVTDATPKSATPYADETRGKLDEDPDWR